MIKGAARSAFLLIRCGLGMPPAQHHEGESSKQSGKICPPQHRITLMPHEQRLSQIESRHAAKIKHVSPEETRKKRPHERIITNRLDHVVEHCSNVGTERTNRNQKQTPPWSPPSTSSQDPTEFTLSGNFMPLILPPPRAKRQELSHVSGWLHPPASSFPAASPLL